MVKLPKPAVCVVSFSGDKILSVTRRDTEVWSLPGGKVDAGEQNVIAVVRETMEETGIYLEPQWLIPVYSEVVLGDDCNDCYCTAFYNLDVSWKEQHEHLWSIEPGIFTQYISVEKLLSGAFSEYNKKVLKNIEKIRSRM